ncbi:autotransporter outer membrane beta-barrel domain-containing protein [Pelagibacterium montanilacus]|uniref:autotransporter outer membrane beta-barrel domain-containing protein n=1 Tax=Pelagibacterium montanilacus TaxID=2185280 RepID=UPI000F8D3330|nr:autotransporter outer membrane beta-barrel domain-containing protein [Pelagibacterium montanilacus]
MVLSFASSLHEVEALRAFDTLGGEPAAVQPFNAWVGAEVQVYNRPDMDDRWGAFGLVSAGMDYLLGEDALLGISVHYDVIEDPAATDTTITGDGWLVGPYGSIEIGKGVFLETHLLYGQSHNRIDTAFFDGSFVTERLVWQASLSGEWQLGEETRLAPRLSGQYLSETVAPYELTNGSGDTLAMPGDHHEEFRLSLVGQLEHTMVLGGGWALVPRIELSGGIAGLELDKGFGAVDIGLALSHGQSWILDANLKFDAATSGHASMGASMGLAARF